MTTFKVVYFSRSLVECFLWDIFIREIFYYYILPVGSGVTMRDQRVQWLPDPKAYYNTYYFYARFTSIVKSMLMQCILT